MLYYIKVLIWTPAECMQRGTIKSRKIKEKIDVLLLFSKQAASQRCQKFGKSNFCYCLFVKMQQPFKLVFQPWFTGQTTGQCEHTSVTFTLFILLRTHLCSVCLLGGSILTQTKKVLLSSTFFPVFF